MKRTILLTVFLMFPPAVRAGLHYSGETLAELPAQWRGFLLDHRNLRALAVKPPPGLPDSPLRAEYRDAIAQLQRKPDLSADELADLGALLIRLGQPDRAVELLRPAQRRHPQHFRLAANLGTAWQLVGDLHQAADALRQAVRLAPATQRPDEELHLKLVERRRIQKDHQTIDELFHRREKPTAEMLGRLQRLALSLPADARILWQLGEMAEAAGDLRTAAAIFDGCVTELGLTDARLRQRRQQAREAADRLGPASRTDNAGHDEHAGLVFRSPRPLLRRFDPSRLPEPRDSGPTPLPWVVLAETTIDAFARPTFLDYLKKLDGKRVSLTGYMQPVADASEMAMFLLLEYPVGCWFCESPPPTALLLIELPEGKSVMLRRGVIKVEGVLKLNATDPEDFLYSLTDAFVGEVD